VPRYNRDEPGVGPGELPGATHVIIPSYTNASATINEQAIRHDVRRNIEFASPAPLFASQPSRSEEYCAIREIARGLRR